MVQNITDEANKALEAFKSKGPFNLKPIFTGWINQTFRVDSTQGSYILQRLHPVFQPIVNEDIEAVTLELQKKHILTPLLIQTDDKQLWTLVNQGGCWRMQNCIEGHTFDKIANPQIAFEVGQLVGKFHQALQDFSYQYRFTRANVHNTRHFFLALEKWAEEGKHHERYDDFMKLAEKILKLKPKLPDFSNLPKRHSHGDLKINNILFNDHAKAKCLLDLDTLGRMPWPLEMGDAFRSWCNLEAEDAANSVFSEDIFSQALQAYADVVKDFWTKEEIEMLFEGIWVLPVELSVRFLIDVLQDEYWGWDSSRYASRSDHNLSRALGQWSLYQDIEKKSSKLQSCIYKAFQ